MESRRGVSGIDPGRLRRPIWLDGARRAHGLSRRRWAVSGRILHRFRKNSSEEVRATISEFKGTNYASIRVYYEAEPGVWRPTKKGLTIAVDLLDELEQAVQALKEAAA